MPAAADADSLAPRRRSLAPFFAAAILGWIAGDAARLPQEQWGARAAVAAIDAYRASVSPLLRRGGLVLCRFTPSCSAYAREAFARFGTVRGAAYAGGRLLRCHPWTRGGYDPVPMPRASAISTWRSGP